MKVQPIWNPPPAPPKPQCIGLTIELTTQEVEYIVLNVNHDTTGSTTLDALVNKLREAWKERALA